MPDLIPDEAVEAAAQELFCRDHPDLVWSSESSDDTRTVYRDDALAALTAAAPLILAERDEQLRALVDRWAGKASGDDFTHSERITWRKCTDALDALLRGAK